MSCTQNGKYRVRWYLTPMSILIAILVAGPLAIPLVCMSPSLKKWHKILITVLLILLTAWFVKASGDLYKNLTAQLAACR